ncbi:hypothetical protein [Mucilaginibacter paludis]|uniref:Uncharacterized protein n=1 Tax=Mucilaginibacter paludis DSM 18603 TaxID=714943 RepID=H1Y5S0_9SPHI|nr:hypothetical protein [Mucilaginibacter paludis]EHQ29846.1 hypothetical protein Mucpa_5778 [Mucilaginibacter paludis DSM 18603]
MLGYTIKINQVITFIIIIAMIILAILSAIKVYGPALNQFYH